MIVIFWETCSRAVESCSRRPLIIIFCPWRASRMGCCSPSSPCNAACQSGPLSAVHFSRHKWPGGLVNQDSGRLQRVVFHCPTTGTSTAPCTPRRTCCPTHCATYCDPCQTLLRAFSKIPQIAAAKEKGLVKPSGGLLNPSGGGLLKPSGGLLKPSGGLLKPSGGQEATFALPRQK